MESTPRKRRSRSSSFGTIEKLPSGRYRAKYTVGAKRYTAPTPLGLATHETKLDASKALARVQTALADGTWRAPGAPDPDAMTFEQFVEDWRTRSRVQTRTREWHDGLLRNRLLPTFGPMRLVDVTPAVVSAWYAGTAQGTPTAREHAYSLLRTILNDAVRQELLSRNPCKVVGAGRAKPAKEIRPATPSEVLRIADAVPSRYRLMILLAAQCGLRFGELAALRPDSIDLDARVIRVRHSVARTQAGRELKAPKSAAGVRDVALPAGLLGEVQAHLGRWADATWLFPSADSPQPVTDTALRKVFRTAARDAGRPDLTFHHLRHTALTAAAQEGATLRELQALAGHSTVQAALRYQHAEPERMAALAERVAERYGDSPR